MAEAQKAGGICAFVDAEHALDVGYARKLGVRTDDLLISQPDTGEQALEIADMLVRSGSVDCVVVGYLYGRGKRAAFGIGALLVAVYDPERDLFVSVSKVSTGLTDDEWREVRERCEPFVSPDKPARVESGVVPSVWVEPVVVVVRVGEGRAVRVDGLDELSEVSTAFCRTVAP